MRPMFLASACLLLSGVAAGVPTPTPTPSHHAGAPEDPYRIAPVSGGVSVLYGPGGNVGILAGPDAVLVVDSQLRQFEPRILAQIRKVSAKPIRYLVNTHHHGDHTGGNAAFRPLTVIVAQDNVRKRMLAQPEVVRREYPALLEEAKKAGNAEDAAFFEDALAWAAKVKVEDIPVPQLTFEDAVRIHVGNETIQVWHVPPSHTDGDSVVYFEKANVVHMGDVLFAGDIPFIDANGGGSARGYLAALDAVLARIPATAKVIPGHGPVTDVAGLKQFRQYVSDVIDLARRAKAEGKTKAEFLASAALPQYAQYPAYKDRFLQNCIVAWDEVAAP